MITVKSLSHRSAEQLSPEYRVNITTDTWCIVGLRSHEAKLERGGNKPCANREHFGAARLRSRYVS